MISGKAFVSVGCLVLGLTLLGRSSAAFDPYAKLTYLTFDGPVRLPHVTLGAGTYLFEARNEVGPGLRAVRVTSRDRSKTYFVAFTRIVARPDGLSRNQHFSLGEAVPGDPRPIDVWFPHGEPTGLKFEYREH